MDNRHTRVLRSTANELRRGLVPSFPKGVAVEMEDAAQEIENLHAEIERSKMVLRMSRNEHAKSLTRNRETYAGATGNLRDAVKVVLNVCGEIECSTCQPDMNDALDALRIAVEFPPEPEPRR